MGGQGSQRMQVLAMILDDLNSTPGTHMVEGEGRNLTLKLIIRPPYACCSKCT